VNAAAFLSATIIAAASAAAQPFVQSAVPDETRRTLTINGVNFGATPPAVYLDFQPLAVQEASPTHAVVTLPAALPPGTYSLIVVQGTQIALADVTLGASGALTAAPQGTAAATQAFASAPLSLAASSFDATAAAPELQTFRWLARPLANNTNDPGARLDLLFGAGGVAPAPTGLALAENGRVQFAAGQQFPGVVRSVSAGSGLALTGTPENVTLAITSGVTGAMIANGTLQSADIANNTVGTAKLGVDPATQTELAQHGHDLRYYTRTSHPSFRRRYTKITRTASGLNLFPTPDWEFAFGGDGFDKFRDDSQILVLWNGTVFAEPDPLDPTSNKFCGYQLRIDDEPAPSGAGQAEARVMNQSTPVAVSAAFDGLPSGRHFISIWTRSNFLDDGFTIFGACSINPAAIPETILIIESGR
jgi:hypothetical protein